jgi:hypothetical protein
MSSMPAKTLVEDRKHLKPALVWSALNGTMVLFDDVVEVFDLATITGTALLPLPDQGN